MTLTETDVVNYVANIITLSEGRERVIALPSDLCVHNMCMNVSLLQVDQATMSTIISTDTDSSGDCITGVA